MQNAEFKLGTEPWLLSSLFFNFKNMEQMIQKLKKLASRSTRTDDSEDFCPIDCFGGNMDDAYSGGLTDGETLLARELLDLLQQPYEKNV